MTIPEVKPGQTIQAQHINDIAKEVNWLNEAAVDNYFGTTDQAGPSNNLPWFIDPDAALCATCNYRLHVQVGNTTVECTPYSGEKKCGDFYCCVQDSVIEGGTGECCVKDEDQVSALSGWQKIKVYTLHGISSEADPTDVSGPYVVEYHNICPTFSKAGEGKPYGAWQYIGNGKFKYCNFQLGRTTYELDDQEIQLEGTGATVYLNITHTDPENAAISTEPIDNSLSTTHVPIVKLNKDYEIVNDYRGMPIVPVWSTPTT